MRASKRHIIQEHRRKINNNDDYYSVYGLFAVTEPVQYKE